MIAVAAAMAMLFVVGLTQLFLLRFKAGDVYPPYSSLRCDPMGIQALYESLDRVAAGRAQRNFRPPDRIAVASRTTVLVSGLSQNGFFLDSEAFGRLMTNLSTSGGRLVLTFTTPIRDDEARDDGAASPCPKEEGDEQGQEPSPQPTEAGDDTDHRWQGMSGMGFEMTTLSWDDQGATKALRPAWGPAELPSSMPWRPILGFDLRDDAWRILYAYGGRPVVVDRPWGRGTVVMMADSFLLSNEALRRQRQIRLLGWLVGPSDRVVFDEFHHGLSHRPGIATLARRYRLHGVFGALLVVTLLMLWRQVAVFVPPLRDPEPYADGAPVVGRDTNEGLVDLARGHIDKHQLLAVCHDTWRTYGIRRVSATVAGEIATLVRQAVADPKRHDTVDVYRRICRRLKKGKQQP